LKELVFFVELNKIEERYIELKNMTKEERQNLADTYTIFFPKNFQYIFMNTIKNILFEFQFCIQRIV